MTLPTLAHHLDRSVFILAKPDTVFAYFQDSARWASWWGAGSTIDPRPGGKVYIRFPNNVEALGEVVEIAAPSRIVFTFGYASGTPMGPGESRVTIALAREGAGTRLTLTHEFGDASSRDQHVQGWRFHLSVFANVIANALHADVNARADAWFAAWAETDDAKRSAALTEIAASDVRFGDRYSLLTGIAEISTHAGAAQKFMPGMTMVRHGDARHCLGTALVDWHVPGPDGTPKAKGTNLFAFDADGKVTSVTGFWA